MGGRSRRRRRMRRASCIARPRHSVTGSGDAFEGELMSDTSEKTPLKAEDIPDWVPPSVKSMAMAIATGLPVEGTAAHRLLTDPRMESVWRELKKHEITRDALDSLDRLERMSTWDMSDWKVSPQDQAYAAFYARLAIQFAGPRNVVTRAQASAKPWHDAARLCWDVMRSARPRVDTELAQALAIVGEYFEEQGQLQERNPYIVERSSGLRGEDDEIRVRTRLIGKATHSIFGSTLYGTVAKVASVAMQTSVSEKNVQNWCSDLAPNKHHGLMGSQ